MNRWLAVTVAVVGLFFLAASTTSAQIKYSQRGFFLMDYKSAANVSRNESPKDFSETEWNDFSTFRGRFWNTFSLGKSVFATWTFETDIQFGKISGGGSKSSDNSAFSSAMSSRGDRVNIETAELFLDMAIPHTDYRIRGGQIPMTVVLPVYQERTTGFKLYRAAGKIRPTIIWIPAEKVLGAQGQDDNIFGAWVDFRPVKGLFIRPYWWGVFRNQIGTEDRENLYYGFNARYKTKGWYTHLNFAWLTGERDFMAPTPDRDISAVSADGAFSIVRGPHTYSLVLLYRGGDDPRTLAGQDIHAFNSIATFFANGSRITQIVSSSFQHPSLDLEISTFGGPNNDTNAGWFLAMLRWDWKATKKALLSFAYTHVRSQRSIQTDGTRGGDSTHIGEAFDVWLAYKLNRNLSVNAGTAFMFSGDALDFWDGSRTRDADNVWNGFVSAIFRF